MQSMSLCSIKAKRSHLFCTPFYQCTLYSNSVVDKILSSQFPLSSALTLTLSSSPPPSHGVKRDPPPLHPLIGFSNCFFYSGDVYSILQRCRCYMFCRDTKLGFKFLFYSVSSHHHLIFHIPPRCFHPPLLRPPLHPPPQPPLLPSSLHYDRALGLPSVSWSATPHKSIHNNLNLCEIYTFFCKPTKNILFEKTFLSSTPFCEY